MSSGTPPKTIFNVLALIVGLFVLGAMVSVVYQLVEPFPIERTSDFWTGDAEGHSQLYFITAEIKHKFDFSRTIMPRVVGYRRYTLHVLDIPGGKTRVPVILGDLEGRENYPRVLGVTGERIWLWNDGLEARDLETLAIRGGSPMIREANPELTQVFPNAPEFFRVSARLNRLLVKSLDARYFALAEQGWKLNLLDDEQLGVTDFDCRLIHQHVLSESGKPTCGKVWYGKAKYLFESARSKGQALWGTTVPDFLHQNIRGKNGWYALLSIEERSQLSDSAIDNPGKPYSDVVRLFYRAGFRLDRWGKELVLDLDGIEVVGNERFLKGGMLIRRDIVEEVNYTWRLESPASVFVLHQKTLEEHSPWRLARLGLDGNVIWQVDMGLSVIQQYLPTHQTVVFGGYATSAQGTSMKSPFQIVMIDVRNGHTVIHSL